MEFVAGACFGLAVMAIVGVVWLYLHLTRQNAVIDRERKLLLNKAFVRDGQARLFGEAIVNEGLETETPSQPKPPLKLQSPFRKGLVNKRAELNSQTAERTEAGQDLPENIKTKIADAAKKAQEKAA